VRVAVCGDPDPDVLDDLQREFGRPVELVPVSEEELADGIRRAYAAAESMVEVVNDLREGEGLSGTDDRELADARDLASQPPVVKYVNLLIKEAHDARASDIHLESTPQGLRARFRVDGVLADAPRAAATGAKRDCEPRKNSSPSWISRNDVHHKTGAFGFVLNPRARHPRVYGADAAWRIGGAAPTRSRWSASRLGRARHGAGGARAVPPHRRAPRPAS